MLPSLLERARGNGRRPLARILVSAALSASLVGAEPLRPLTTREAHAGELESAADSIRGEWWTENKAARIRFEKHADGTYRGVVSWAARPRNDRLNRDPKLRARPIVGSVLIWHLVYRDQKYEEGAIYNPEDGDTYRVKAWLTSATSLKLRGYLGISLLGQTQTWSRYR